MDEKLISVVIPVYNQADTIEGTVTSVLNQTYPNMEVIVVDDGSDMDVGSIVTGLGDNRVSYYKLEHKNANVARNYGICKSKGKYIAMLDADDCWKPRHLADCLAVIEETAADGLYGSLILKNTVGDERTVMVSTPNEGESMINYLLRVGYGAQTSTLFLVAECAKDILWDPALGRHQDYDFVVRFSKKYKFAVKTLPTAIYHLRIRQGKPDFRSCMKFIKANEHDIDPGIYHGYHLNMLRWALRVKETSDIIRHYRKEAAYYKELLTYGQYMQICQPANRFQKLVYKWRYLYYILCLKVEL